MTALSLRPLLAVREDLTGSANVPRGRLFGAAFLFAALIIAAAVDLKNRFGKQSSLK
jgi:hypothetical protein